MPSFTSPTSAVFSPTSAVFSPHVPSVPLTTSVLVQHDQLLASAEYPTNDDEMIECGPSASPFTRMLVDRANGVASSTKRSKAVSETSSGSEDQFFCTAGASQYTKKKVAKARLDNNMRPLVHDKNSKSLNAIAPVRGKQSPHRKITSSQSDVCRPRPQTVTMFSKKYRLTPGLVNEARSQNHLVVWINRGPSSYYMVFHKMSAFHLFVNTNLTDISKGNVCMDETKLSNWQKPHLHIDCLKNTFKDVADDFSTGGHIDMLLVTLSKFVAAISLVHVTKSMNQKF